ncbi:MAG: helix-hairpin-helix domain-containing protein, partial [Bacteroidota bacterium]
DYFDHREPLRKCASHRLLAMRRGEEEGVLKVKIQVPEATAIGQLEPLFLKGSGPATEQVQQAIKDGYKRLLAPAMETEFRQESKERADREAIRVFQANLRQLLLGAPLGQKRVLAIDPGFRTGCKLVCLDEQGKLLHNETIYPHPPQRQTKVAAAKVKTLVEQYKVEAIAVGNGTAGRETEQFLGYIRFKTDVKAFMVSENGASVYSASKVARDEFPQYDVTVRGAVSIGRRLMDPLAELVKIEPKAIGVGQYQHDVDQAMLLDSLDQVVTSCVNQVGVNLNTASKHLLNYVSGLGPQLAENIVQHRKEHGPFRSRKELLNVARMGPKAFEQAAGFLRIPGAEFPLDNSAVHPERYALVRQMARDLNVAVEALIGPTGQSGQVEPKQYLGEGIGLPTLNDILEELKKPGRDPRKKAEAFQFDKSVHRPEDLDKGMVLPGIVTNITNFGAFVDVGVKQDGLVHISELADRFVRDPNEVVALHQQVRVRVLEVDLARKRIAFSMRALPEEA